MTTQTIQIYAADSVILQNADGGAIRNPNLLNQGQWGNSFSWEVPDNVEVTIPAGTEPVSITFDDSNGLLGDDPYSGSTVVDQKLTEPVTIDGVTYSPSATSVRWQTPAPVDVELEYQVTLYDDAGNAYTMAAVSITTGYTTTVVGVTFVGDAPPPGTTLTYIQNVSTYTGNGTVPISELAQIICFLRGTEIATPAGSRPIETLRPGEMVLTLDHGPQPLRWIGCSIATGQDRLAPIRIAAGTLGNARDLWVSPNHRMLLTGWRAELLFGEPEVLAPAKFLVDDCRIRPDPRPVAEYWHMLFDRHEIVFAEGAASESLHPGTVALDAVGEAARAEMLTLFPELAGGSAQPTLSRYSLNRREAMALTH